MKNKLTVWSGVAVLALVAWASPSFAADTGKEVTIKGEGKCAKCALHETEKCQNVIEAKDKSGKKELTVSKIDLAKGDKDKE